MDTKLKKSNKFLYGLMFVLCVICFVASLLGAVGGTALIESNHLYGNDFWMLYFPDDYNLSDGGSGALWEITMLRNQLSVCLGAAIICGIITIASFIWLCFSAGDRGENGKIILKSVDRSYTEIQILVFLVMLFIGAWFFGNVIFSATYKLLPGIGYYDADADGYELLNFSGPALAEVAIAAAIGLTAAFIGLWMIMSCVRKIKAGSFLRQSIIGKLCITLYETMFAGGSLMRKVMIVAVLAWLLSVTVIPAIVVLILIFVFLPKMVRKYEGIKYGIDEVRSGNLSYKIQVSGNGELDKLAEGINEISQSSSAAVQNEMKNQRMKAELISNVSHDLKTPLTSLVTYIDLLKTEGLTSANAPEYLNILDTKTNRLKQLTEDLFEAAKASSGTIPVKKERVDVLSLVNQGLGEMDQRIKESGLEIIVKAEREKYYVWADGQLLWRVVENLFSNVLKYAQEHTRVYIDITEQGAFDKPSMVVLEMKNISKQALNIDADELMERFKRGDESRNTDGSGLGLAIAKDLVKLQNGWFDIKIDGDLFKAIVMLEKAAENNDAQADAGAQ